MPYIIHIPRPYQSRAHILPTKPTTTATHISINDWSPVARAVYADTTAWGCKSNLWPQIQSLPHPDVPS